MSTIAERTYVLLRLYFLTRAWRADSVVMGGAVDMSSFFRSAIEATNDHGYAIQMCKFDLGALSSRGRR